MQASKGKSGMIEGRKTQMSKGDPRASEEKGASQVRKKVMKYLREIGENGEKERDWEKDVKRKFKVFKLYETDFKFDPVIEWFFTWNYELEQFQQDLESNQFPGRSGHQSNRTAPVRSCTGAERPQTLVLSMSLQGKTQIDDPRIS